ncbi:hypothetical protein NFI96_030210, partial [Prochilodus magdalenae]
KNLALYGKATQSDLVSNPWAPFGHAYNAIDGNTDPDYNHGSCTATDIQQNPWWRVDLLDEYTVTSITITNRGDCCPERINGAEIHIGNSLLNNGNSNPRAGEITSIPAGRSITLKFKKGISGRYVNVVLPGDYRLLTLCEVEVYGYPTPHGENVALGRAATQSSLYSSAFASAAIDGNRDGVFSHGSCTHTNNDQSPWWRLDWSTKLHRHQHKVVFQWSCHRGTVWQRTTPSKMVRCGVVSTASRGPTFTFYCKGMEGRYINIVIPGRSEYLTLCEVEVYGVPLV